MYALNKKYTKTRNKANNKRIFVIVQPAIAKDYPPRPMLIETKVSKTRSKQMKNLKVFATTNNVDALSQPLRSRFMEFHLPEYTFDQFCEIARRLLNERFGHSNQVADEIASAVWNKMHSKDIRNVLAIAKLVHNIEDVSWLVQIYKKYERMPGGIGNSYGEMT